MANRYFTQFFYSFFKKPVIIAGSAVFDTTGPTFKSYDIKGVSSITINGTGDYTINLADKYSKLVSFSAVIESTTNQDRIFQIDSSAVDTGVLGIRCLSSATPTNPADETKIYFKIVLSDSSAK
jgi:hypothetical protein